MTKLRRSASLDRLLAETDYRHKILADRSKCSMRGYPYCCTADYYSYRYWPYYLDHRAGDHSGYLSYLHHRVVDACSGVSEGNRAFTPYSRLARVGDSFTPLEAYLYYYRRHRFSSRYPFELYPEYYSEYLRGYNYGLWKYGV